ncbi:MAG TPA: hypothetical protein VGI71_23810 [Scandinavium sp.]|jgi:TolA-binding protein
MGDSGLPPGWIPYIVGVIIAIFGGGGLAALIRARPEGSKIVVDAAQGAVIVQSGVITDLRHQLRDAQDQIDELRGHISEMSLLRVENDRLRSRVTDLEHDNEWLRERISSLEGKTGEAL